MTIFAIQIALGELLRHHGAKPAAVVGQSLGEAAAAYFAGVLSLSDATRTICARSHLMGQGEARPFYQSGAAAEQSVHDPALDSPYNTQYHTI